MRQPSSSERAALHGAPPAAETAAGPAWPREAPVLLLGGAVALFAAVAFLRSLRRTFRRR